MFSMLKEEIKIPSFFGPSAVEIKTRGAFAELIYRPDGDNSNWYAVGLYNWVESNIGSLDLKTALYIWDIYLPEILEWSVNTHIILQTNMAELV